MKKYINLSLVLVLVLFQLSCQKRSSDEKSIVLLSINDVYRTDGMSGGQVGGLSRVAKVRQDLINEGKKVLMFHGGDFLHPSFSSRINYGAEMIDVLNQLDLNDGFDESMFVVFGNHEFDKGRLEQAGILQDRINESQFNWVDSNINWKTKTIESKKLNKSLVKEVNGIKVGIFGLTTNMVQPEYIESFDDPMAVTKHYVKALREQGVDIVIALTHQRLSDDKKLLELEDEYRPDLIIGGHEHYRQLENTNGNWIVKADADAASMAVIEVTKKRKSNIEVFPTILDLDESIETIRSIDQNIRNWQQQTHVKYCQSKKLESNCLEEVYGFTKIELVAEESEIRRFETNIGNFIADGAVKEFQLCNADGALINSGGVRLNYNIPANSSITRLHIEGLFPYPTNLKLIEISGKTLKEMINHSISMWTANGHWLITSGIRYTHNPETQTFSNLRRSSTDKIIQDDEMFKMVVPQYIIDPNTDHDGYHMISEADLVDCAKNNSSLKTIATNRFKSFPNGISPEIDLRICNTQRQSCPE